MGIYLVALCFDPQRRKLKTNKRTKKHTVSKKHTFEEVHVVQVPQGTANPFFEKCLCCVYFCSLCSLLVIHT